MKRFYKTVEVRKEGAGFSLALDGKSIKTPARAMLLVPAKKLAEALAGEWDRQKNEIDPASMPLNRLTNTAIDRTTPRFDEVCREALNFARHDLLCYRAEGPEDLVQAEAKAWDPYLRWVENTHKATFKTTTGLAAVEQDPAALKTCKGLLDRLDPFRLTALHNATTLTGSLILGLALLEGFQGAGKIWAAAHVDEDFQTAKWGEDAEVAKLRAGKKALWEAIDVFLKALD